MEALILKTKKKSTKELIEKVENGKLTGDELTAALEVLKIRNVVVNVPGAKKTGKRQPIEKTDEAPNTTKHPFTVGDTVSFPPAKNSPMRHLTSISGVVVKAFSNTTQHWVRIKLDDGTKIFKLSTACTKVK